MTQQLISVAATLVTASALAAAMSGMAATLPNPASQNCIDRGGTLSIENDAKGEHGICTLPDHRRCEEWSLLRGECPAGAAAKSSKDPSRGRARGKVINARFSCKNGRVINASFFNREPGSVKLALSDGRKLSLPRALSGSGARYATQDDSVVFWNKGDTAFLEEAGSTTYADCVVAKAK